MSVISKVGSFFKSPLFMVTIMLVSAVLYVGVLMYKPNMYKEKIGTIKYVLVDDNKFNCIIYISTPFEDDALKIIKFKMRSKALNYKGVDIEQRVEQKVRFMYTKNKRTNNINLKGFQVIK